MLSDVMFAFNITSKEFTVEQVIEYQWPQEKGGESLMIQEQISEYLGVKSFKRKYPDLKRRIVEAEEKEYLREKGLVTESMCDLGNYIVRFEVFMAVTMNNAIFGDVTPFASCKNQCFRGTYPFHHQDEKNLLGTMLAETSN
jgi:hypothetical protein